MWIRGRRRKEKQRRKGEKEKKGGVSGRALAKRGKKILPAFFSALKSACADGNFCREKKAVYLEGHHRNLLDSSRSL